jgi:hypothetical protein
MIDRIAAAEVVAVRNWREEATGDLRTVNFEDPLDEFIVSHAQRINFGRMSAMGRKLPVSSQRWNLTSLRRPSFLPSFCLERGALERQGEDMAPSRRLFGLFLGALIGTAYP